MFKHKESEDCLKLLIDAGADVNMINERGDSPLMRASSNSSHNHHKKVTETLIKAGANVNYSNGKGRTALMAASCPNCVET